MGPLGEQEWHQIIEEQLSSGKSQAAFCAERGISTRVFQRWKGKLNRGSGFVELEVSGSKEELVGQGHRAELEFPCGVIFRMSW